MSTPNAVDEFHAFRSIHSTSHDSAICRAAAVESFLLQRALHFHAYSRLATRHSPLTRDIDPVGCAPGHRKFRPPRTGNSTAMSDSSDALQGLAEWVRSTLGADARVALSPYVFDRHQRALVAVDAIVTGTIGADPVVVSIEVRGSRRVADVTWIDTMRAKHRRLATTVLLLASKTGFSAEARQVAEHHGIAALSLADLRPSDVAALVGPRSSLWPRTLSVFAERVSLQIAANALLEAEIVPVSANQMLHVEGNAQLGRVRDQVEQLLHSAPARDRLLATIDAGHQKFDLEWSPPLAPGGRALFLRTSRPKTARRVESIQISGSCEVGMGQFRALHEASRAVSISWPRRRKGHEIALWRARHASRDTATVAVRFGPASALAPSALSPWRFPETDL